MGINILHFSDFHLDGNDEQGATHIVESIINALKQESKIDLIIFTGDMVHKGGRGYDNIEIAFKRFSELVIIPMCTALNLTKDRFIFIPGNHDIDRDEDDIAIEDFMERQTTSIEDVVNTLKDPKTEKRTKRINSVKNFEKSHYSFLNQDHYKFSRYDSHFIVDIEGTKVGISALNTVWRCGFNDERKIVMGLSQIRESQHFLNTCDIKIAATHYRYDKLKEFECDELKNLLADYYDIYLTGHTHSISISYLPNGKGKFTLDVNTAGALVSNEFTKHEKHQNAFQIITYTQGIAYNVKEFKQFDGICFSLNKMKGDNGITNYPIITPKEAIKIAQTLREEIENREIQKFNEIVRPFQTLADSRKHIKSDLFILPFEDCAKTLEIKKELANPNNKDIRLMALSGMGKTRIVFDVFESIENVFYSSDNNCGNALNLLLDKITSGVVIIDNCPIERLYSFQESIEQHNSAVKLVTIHNVLIPREKRTDGKILELRYDETEEIIDKLIKREPILEEKDFIKKMIKERSGNIPFMAILLIEAYKKNGNFEINKRHKVLNTLLKGKEGELSINSEKVLKALSIFDPLGYQNNVSDEYKYVISSNKLHRIYGKQSTDVDEIFSEVISDYSRRQLIELNGSCLRIRPRPLAEWLTEAWIEENENKFGEVYNEIIELKNEDLSNRLFRALDNRFAEMTKSNQAKQIFDKYNDPINGSFHDERIAFSKSGSQLFLSMGIVSPVMVAKNLESLIYAKSVEWLKKSLDQDARRNLIWAMENIVVNAESFEAVAKSLGRLALAENESISNNATGLFLQLFHILLPGTRANLSARLEIIQFFESEENSDDLLIKAIDHALNGHHGFIRSSTSKYQSVNNEPEDYYPCKEEICEYWMQCLNILERLSQKGIERQKAVNNVLTKHVSDFQTLGLLSVFLNRLEKVAKKLDYQWDDMRNSLSMTLYYWSKGNETEERILLSWINKLTPKTFYRRLQTYVKDEHYKNSQNWDVRNEYLERGTATLAEEFLKNKIYKTEELKLMVKDEQFNYYWFIKALAQRLTDDNSKDLLTEIYNVVTLEEYNFESPFITSLAGTVLNKAFTKKLFESFYKAGYYRLAASLEGILDDEKSFYINQVIKDTKCGKYDNVSINNYLHYGRGASIQQAFSNFNKMKLEGIDPYEVIYPYLNNSIFLHNIEKIKAERLLEQYKKILLDYPFSENHQGQAHDIIEKISDVLTHEYDPIFALSVHKMAVEMLVENKFVSNPFKHLYSVLLPKYQDAILDDLLDVIAANDIRLRFFLHMHLELGAGLHNGKGPLFQCDEDKLKKTCERHPSELPERLARMCPVYEYEKGKGAISLSNFFLWLCDNYGDNEQMLHEFGANMGTYFWSGIDGFSNYIEQKKKFVEPLLAHPNTTVRKWAEAQCKSIENDVKRERNNEEYTRMVRGEY